MLLEMLLSLFGSRRGTRDDSGATAVEYGLLIALIAAVIILAVALLGTTLNSIFTSVAGLV